MPLAYLLFGLDMWHQEGFTELQFVGRDVLASDPNNFTSIRVDSTEINTAYCIEELV